MRKKNGCHFNMFNQPVLNVTGDRAWSYWFISQYFYRQRNINYKNCGVQTLPEFICIFKTKT